MIHVPYTMHPIFISNCKVTSFIRYDGIFITYYLCELTKFNSFPRLLNALGSATKVTPLPTAQIRPCVDEAPSMRRRGSVNASTRPRPCVDETTPLNRPFSALPFPPKNLTRFPRTPQASHRRLLPSPDQLFPPFRSPFTYFL